jgi:hypothetical protein
MEPLPLPLAPEVTVIHDTDGVEVQEQSLSVATVVEPVPPT